MASETGGKAAWEEGRSRQVPQCQEASINEDRDLLAMRPLGTLSRTLGKEGRGPGLMGMGSRENRKRGLSRDSGYGQLFRGFY